MRSSGYSRVDSDWYIEPRWIVESLLKVEPLSGLSWDPSCGDGNIPKILKSHNLPCLGSDIANRGFAEGTQQDFFLSNSPCDNIISNPPYRLIEPYILHALKLARSKVCLLARLALLEGQKRQRLFLSTPLARIWVSSRRVSMPPGGQLIEPKGGTVAYAWFVWDHSFKGPPTIGWI